MEITKSNSISSLDEVSSFLTQYCEFSPNRAYVLVLIAREKENAAISHGQEPVFREILTDTESIPRRVNRLESIVTDYSSEEGEPLTFRLYISANARDVQKSFFNFQNKLVKYSRGLSNGEESIPHKIKRLDKEWKSTLQTKGNKVTNFFVVDCDSKEEDNLNSVLSQLQEVTTIRGVYETPNGYHFHTDPFGFPNEEWITESDYLEIKTDGLLFLYRQDQPDKSRTNSNPSN
jgi:hypothetical protein